MNFCLCDCHKMWGSTIPPVCTCACRMIVQEPAFEALCKHIRPIKLGCTQCYLESCDKEIDEEQNMQESERKEDEVYAGKEGLSGGKVGFSEVKIKSDVEILLEMIEKLDEKVGFVERALDNYREYKTDIEDLGTDVMYLKQRMAEYEKMEWTSTPLNNLAAQYCNLTDKVKQLEECSFGEQLDGLEQKLDERIEKLEEKLTNLVTMPNIAWAKYNKTPHKCPVCYGAGDFLLQSIEDIQALGAFRTDGMGRKYTKCHACDSKGVLWG